jgi:MoaA/NifB/PqqE/SkfB family radical SAM enzyme
MAHPDQIDLLAEFSRKLAARGKIFEVTAELTHRCNLRCRHCYLPTNSDYPPELSVDDWKRVIDELVAQGLCLITFTGHVKGHLWRWRPRYSTM